MATHHLARADLVDAAEVTTDRVVVDGPIVTAGGVSASIDLGLKILEMNFGKELADEVAARIEYVPPGPVHGDEVRTPPSRKT